MNSVCVQAYQKTAKQLIVLKHKILVLSEIVTD